MEMGENFCQILELGGTTIKGRRVWNERTLQNRPVVTILVEWFKNGIKYYHLTTGTLAWSMTLEPQ